MCLAGAARGWQGHGFPLRVGAPPAAQAACVPAQLGIVLSEADICHLPHRPSWVSLPCPYGLLLCWLHHPVMVWGDSSLLSALCTGPCGVEIRAALPKVAVSEEIAEMQSTQGHPAGMRLPFLVPWGDLLALTVYCVALQVVFMALSSKEELDIVMMIPFLPNLHSAPSFSGMHAPCKWSRGLLPCVLLPGLVPSVSLTFPGACTHFRTEVLSFFFFFSAYS